MNKIGQEKEVSGRVKRVFLAAALLFLTAGILFFYRRELAAEPYLALRTGFKCSACHVNKTGGGKRTDYGYIYSQTNLPSRFITRANKGFFDPHLSDFISTGANFRVRNDVVFRKGPESNSINLAQGTVYFDFQVVPSLLSFYLDNDFAPNFRNREAFALFHSLPAGAYVKAGRMFLPYGWRLQDDATSIRARTGFNYGNSDIGLEIGAEPGPASFSLAVSNGTQGEGDDNRFKQVSTIGSVVYSHARLGGSFSINAAGGEQRNLYGTFVGVSFGSFSGLGEIDWLHTIGPAPRRQLAGFAELDFYVVKGLNLKVAYDYFDPNRNVREDQFIRTVLAGEWFLAQFAQARGGYRIKKGIPQNDRQNEDEVFLELHLFY